MKLLDKYTVCVEWWDGKAYNYFYSGLGEIAKDVAEMQKNGMKITDICIINEETGERI